MKLRLPYQYRTEVILLSLTVVAGLLSILSLIKTELLPTRGQPIEVIPISLTAEQHANYDSDTVALKIPPARVEMIGEIIYDHDARADVLARLATVQANLLTPVPSLLGPTATRIPTATSTRTPTTKPTATLTPTPIDPWVAIGQATVICGNEVVFSPIYAQKIKFSIIAGGGKDNRVSFYCCGSNGITGLINGVWQPLFGREDTLRVGDFRESANLNGVTLSRARFYLGCNDREPITVHLYYLPMPTLSITPTPIR